MFQIIVSLFNFVISFDMKNKAGKMTHWLTVMDSLKEVPHTSDSSQSNLTPAPGNVTLSSTLRVYVHR